MFLIDYVDSNQLNHLVPQFMKVTNIFIPAYNCVENYNKHCIFDDVN